MKRRFPELAFLVLLLGIVVAGVARPVYLWDVVPYTAAVISIDESDSAKVHRKTFDALRDSVPAETFQKLTRRGPVVERVYSDPDALAQQLPFYRIRPLYIWASYILHRLGINPARATVVVSSLSVFAIGVITFAWIGPHIGGPFTVVATLLILYCSQVVNLARHSTADGLATAIQLFSLFMLLKYERVRLACVIALVAIGARTDALLGAALLVTYLAIWAPPAIRLKLPAAISFGIVGVTAYWVIGAAAGNYGYETLFYQSFLGKLVDPGSRTIDVSWSDYLGVCATNARYFLKEKLPAAMCMIALLVFWRSRRRRASLGAYGDLSLVMVVALILRFLAFPRWEARFFAINMLLIWIALVVVLFPRSREKETTSAGTTQIPVPL